RGGHRVGADRRRRERPHHPVRELAAGHRADPAARAHPGRARHPSDRPLRPPHRGEGLMAGSDTGAAVEPVIGTAPDGAVPLRSAEGAPLWPPVPRVVLTVRIVIGVVLAAAALIAPFSFDPSTNRVLSEAIYIAIAAMGLNLLTGFNGQVSIGHGAFFGVGAFTTAILMVDH